MTLQAGPEDRGLRLDIFLARHLGQFTRSHIQALNRSGAVRVGSRQEKAGYRIRGDEVIEVDLRSSRALRVWCLRTSPSRSSTRTTIWLSSKSPQVLLSIRVQARRGTRWPTACCSSFRVCRGRRGRQAGHRPSDRQVDVGSLDRRKERLDSRAAEPGVSGSSGREDVPGAGPRQAAPGLRAISRSTSDGIPRCARG